jgi:hypothetical protein
MPIHYASNDTTGFDNVEQLCVSCHPRSRMWIGASGPHLFFCTSIHPMNTKCMTLEVPQTSTLPSRSTYTSMASWTIWWGLRISPLLTLSHVIGLALPMLVFHSCPLMVSIFCLTLVKFHSSTALPFSTSSHNSSSGPIGGFKASWSVPLTARRSMGQVEM